MTTKNERQEKRNLATKRRAIRYAKNMENLSKEKKDQFEKMKKEVEKRDQDKRDEKERQFRLVLDNTYNALVKYKFHVSDAANYLNVSSPCVRYRMIKMRECKRYNMAKIFESYEVQGMATNEERLKYYDQISRR